MRKNYVLDANVLIHDPHSVFRFVDNVVIIPVGVIRELDRFKREQTDRGVSARQVIRILDGLRGDHGLAGGVDLENGGRLRVYCDPEKAMANDNLHADTEMLRTAAAIRDAEPAMPVIIVTKDISLRIRADAAGLRAEDYESDRVLLSDVYAGHTELTLTHDQISEFKHAGELMLPGLALSPNEYVLLKIADSKNGSALGRFDGRGRIRALQSEESLWGIKPRNKEQYFAMDALLDDNVKLVTLLGKAGTGKTLIAMAAALHLTLKKKRYRGMLVCRPIVPVGRDIGYLPGDIGQKLDPWLKPVADTVEFLLDSGGAVKGHNDVDALIDSGVIEIQPLTYIRGRSIANRFAVIDEAQNLTPLEVKTIITRMGTAAKIVLTGDPFQIDNPYVDGNSNGFTYLVNRFRDQEIAAHVELRKGERSQLAELAANLL
ncbi:MAG: PhoH family protein [Phycisphaerae bacterium]